MTAAWVEAAVNRASILCVGVGVRNIWVLAVLCVHVGIGREDIGNWQ